MSTCISRHGEYGSHTALADTLGHLRTVTEERDEAHATIERQRLECADTASQLAEVQATLKRTEDLWMVAEESAKTGIADTIRHHHAINALEQRLADALKIADDNAAEASAAWREASRVSAEWDEARRTVERLAAVGNREQFLSQLEEAREDRDALIDKATRWRKRAKKRKEKLSYARLLAITQAERVARMSPVVEAALEWRGEGLPVPDYALVDEEIALRDAVAAYQTATVVSAEPADNPQAEQVSPVTQTAEREPRVWRIGDDEPGFEVTAVRDNDGDVWTRSQPGIWKTTLTRSKLPMTATWIGLTHQWAPLTDATPQDTTSPAGATQDGEDVADGCQVPDETDVDIYVPAIRAAALRAAASDLADAVTEMRDRASQLEAGRD